MTAPLPLSSVNHLALMTRRLAESRAFYRDVLGFREVARPNFDFAGSWLFNYGLTIHLIENEKAGDPTGPIDTRSNHLAFHADDLAAIERGLAARGIDYRKNMIRDGGIRQLFFRDPDGHHIEVGAYPPTPPYIDATPP